MTKRPSQSSRRGFTLIELAIVLGVVAVLAAGLFRLMSSGNSQSKDAATAQQQEALISAVAGYLSDTSTGGGQNLLRAMAANATQNIPLPANNSSLSNCQNFGYTGGTGSPYVNMCNYLPPGFYTGSTNSYNQNYAIQVLKDGAVAGTAPQTYSYVIIAMATASSIIPDTDGGRISSLIGGDGGFIYTSNICSATAHTACGTMGAWQSTVTTQYGFTAAQSLAGSVVSRSYVSPGVNNSYSWLARVQMPGDTSFSFNTMSAGTNMYMAPGANLYMYPSGGATSGNNIFMDTGALIFSGTNLAGSIQLNTGGSIIGGGNASIPQIKITQPQAVSDTNGAPSPIQVSAGCSLVGVPGSPLFPPDPNCQAPALSVTYGDVYVGGQITATKIFSASDERLKTDIKPLNGALDNIMKIDPVSFSFKQGGGQSMGVIAQELEKVYPQLVSENHGTKYVEYNGLIGPMLAAIQELKQQNDSLKSQLAEEKAREDRIEGTVQHLPLNGTP